MNGYDYYGYSDEMANYGPQFDFDPVMLRALGFSDQEMQILSCIVQDGSKVTVNNMVNYYGIPYEQAHKIKYMYDICSGKVVINSDEDLSKHLRKLFGKHQRIGMQDLAVSRVGEIPRTALVAGIPKDSPFAIWNSKQYDPLNRMYRVVDVGSNSILIETNRIPRLKYKQDKFIDGVLTIKEGPTNGKLLVSINRKYCRLCNRFVIVASLRRPEFHLGMIEIICVEGTKVYVFADMLAAKSYSRYGNATQRIYDYGFYPFEIQDKLTRAAQSVYRKLCGVHVNRIKGNMDFVVLEEEKKEESLEDELIIV